MWYLDDEPLAFLNSNLYGTVRNSPKSIETDSFPSSAKDDCWRAMGGLFPLEVTDIASVRSGLVLAIGGLCMGVYPAYVLLLTVSGRGEPGVDGGLAPFGYTPGGGDPCGA